MRRAVATVFAVVLSLVFGTAAAADTDSLTWLEWVGKYIQLEATADRQMQASKERNTSRLAPLCVAYSRLKRYDKLFPCLEELQARIDRGDGAIRADLFLVPSSDATPLPSTLRAEALIDLADYDGAIKAARMALERTGKSSAGFGGSELWSPIRYRIVNLSNLALALALSGRRGEIPSVIQELVDIPTASFGNSAIWRQTKNVGLGRAHIAAGEYRKAIEVLDDTNFSYAFSAFGTTVLAGGDSFLTMVDLSRQVMLGRAYRETGDRARARQYLDKLLGNPRVLDQRDIYWNALFERGLLLEQEGNIDGAIADYREAVKIIEQQRSSINTEASKIGFVGDKQAVYGKLVALLVAQGRVAESFDYVERSKSRALVDMLASRREFSAKGLDPEHVKRVLAQLAAADLAARVADDTVNPKEPPKESAAVRNLQAAQREIREVAPELSTLVTVSSVSVDDLKALIGEDEALVEYYYQGSDLYIFVLSKQRLQAVRLGAAGLARQVQAFRRALERVGSDAWQVQARVLYDRVWKPVEDIIAAKNVVIVAHGALHYLPFAVLQKPDGGVLIDQASLRFLPSASVLKFLRPALAGKEARLLILGNPDLGDPKMDLQFAESEARAVATIFPDSLALVRREASETNFKKAAGIFARLHVASHGKFQADDPLSSGLYLARDGDNDGVLTVGELYSMSLDADLVTLSACETGLGRIANGDDVVGLTRGFLYAGSRSVVASLWSVDDKATAELMKAFYENLGKLSKQEALRQAQIKVRQAFSHPFFWAGFQLTGRPD